MQRKDKWANSLGKHLCKVVWITWFTLWEQEQQGLKSSTNVIKVITYQDPF